MNALDQQAVTAPALDVERLRIIEARHHDPFSVLGKHSADGGVVVRAHIPYARDVTIAEGDFPMSRVLDTDIFEWHGPATAIPDRYRLVWRDVDNHQHVTHDPYTFPSQVSELDRDRFAAGNHRQAYSFMGAHERDVEGIAGVLFCVWAPNADRVSVVGDFNRWDGRRHPMRLHAGSGIWELFIPNLGHGLLYKFEIRNRYTGEVLLKSDPYGRQFELRPNTASIVPPRSTGMFGDGHQLQMREAHLGCVVDQPARELPVPEELSFGVALPGPQMNFIDRHR